MKPFTQLTGTAAPLPIANVDTDQIIPKQFLKTVSREGLAKGLFYDLKTKADGSPDPDFVLNRPAYAKASILIAKENFGCGSSREQACSALKGHGLVVVADGFARIFQQNAVNVGLQVVAAPGVEAAEDDSLELRADVVVNLRTGHRYPIVPLPPARQAIVDAGGLIPYTRKRLEVAGVSSPS